MPGLIGAAHELWVSSRLVSSAGTTVSSRDRRERVAGLAAIALAIAGQLRPGLIMIGIVGAQDIRFGSRTPTSSEPVTAAL